MIKQFLFDLDGTLIHFDHHLFVKNYVALLSKKLADYVDPAEFTTHLLMATGSMIKSTDGTKTNAEKFWMYFKQQTKISPEQITPLIDEFYATDFHHLKPMITIPKIAPILAKISAKHIPVAIATNPVFPKAAVQARLSWGGFSESQFNLITTYENSHYCKPNPAYYAEIIDKLGITANECMMIGNDVSEDLSAGQIGIKTYLLTDAIINRYEMKNIPADYIGTIENLQNDINSILA